MSKVLELKGSVLSLSSLRIYQADLAKIKADLTGKINQAPSFFKGLSLVIEPEVAGLDLSFLAELVKFLQDKELVVLGIRSQDLSLIKLAESLGLPNVLSASQREVLSQEKPQSPEGFKPAQIYQGAVRSGQQVYASDGDLIVVGSVNPGAEVVADGHIHIYGKLLGKAFAGAKGNVSAQVFVKDLDAELVCIAGCYQTSDDIEKLHKNNAVSIVLQDGSLIYTSI